MSAMSGAMLAAVAAGGAIGAVARYAVTVWIGRAVGHGFPLGTLAVNLLGSLLIGVVIELAARHLSLSGPMRAFIVTGCLGALTTFSAFALDAVVLMERGQGWSVLAYVVASVAGCIAAVMAGMALVRAVAG